MQTCMNISPPDLADEYVDLHRIQVFEIDAWLQFCNNHPDMRIAQTYFENISCPDLVDEYADLNRIQVFEIDAWLQFCNNHPDMHIAQTSLENISPPDLAVEYADPHEYISSRFS